MKRRGAIPGEGLCVKIGCTCDPSNGKASVQTCLFWVLRAPSVPGVRPSASSTGSEPTPKYCNTRPSDTHVPLFAVLCGRIEPTLQALTAWLVPRKDKAIREQRPILEEKDTSVVAPQHPVQTTLL